LSSKVQENFNLMKKTAIILILGIFMFSCQPRQTTPIFDIQKEKPKVETAIHNSIGWVKDKDTTMLYSIIADDENYLEVHPENTVVIGIEKFREAERFWLDERFKHVSFKIWDLKINFSADGNVAWFYCMLNDFNDWQGQAANWENTRWTGVLEKREGKWRMVQMHFSYPSN